MKTFIFLLIATLALAGSAYAQSDTSATIAADGTYPPGTSFNGVPLAGLEIETGAIVAGDGSGAEGKLTVQLLGMMNPLTGTQQIITVEADINGGSRPGTNVAVVSGTCTIDMGDGTPPLPSVPIVATITRNDQNLGSVGLTLGATQLPTGMMNDGSMTVADLSP